MNVIEKGTVCPDGYIGALGDDTYIDDAENRAVLDLCDNFNSHCDVCPHRAFCNTSTLIVDCLSTVLNRKHLNMDSSQNEEDLEALTHRLETLCGIPLTITFERMDDSKFPPEAAFEEKKTGTKAAEPPTSDDAVNSPKHYCQGGIECIDVIEATRGREGCIQFCLGNAIKYLFRDQYKGRPLEDLKKAQWYINKAISLMEGE